MVSKSNVKYLKINEIPEWAIEFHFGKRCGAGWVPVEKGRRVWRPLVFNRKDLLLNRD